MRAVMKTLTSPPMTELQAPSPGKPISVNQELNLANPGLKFILRSDSVPESTININ